MKSTTLKLLAVLAAGATLLTAAPAHADRDGHREWRDHDRGEWRDHHRGRHHGHHRRHWGEERVVVRERYIERRPVVREYGYYERPVEYYAPAPIYAPAPVYSRNPGLVIGVSLPPIVIPFR